MFFNYIQLIYKKNQARKPSNHFSEKEKNIFCMPILFFLTVFLILFVFQKIKNKK
jgi:hypothetical protein